jgi:hypothetical protein
VLDGKASKVEEDIDEELKGLVEQVQGMRKRDPTA